MTGFVLDKVAKEAESVTELLEIRLLMGPSLDGPVKREGVDWTREGLGAGIGQD